MRKVDENYNLLCQFENVMLDFVEERECENFIYTYISILDGVKDYQDTYFSLLVTEDDFKLLQSNKYIEIDEVTLSEERGKAALFDLFMELGCNSYNGDVLPTSPLSYLRKDSLESLHVKNQKQQAFLIANELYNHIKERGFKDAHFTREYYDFYFAHFKDYEELK